MSDDRALCACTTVKYAPVDLGNGMMRERWTCAFGCGTEFVRKPSAGKVDKADGGDATGPHVPDAPMKPSEAKGLPTLGTLKPGLATDFGSPVPRLGTRKEATSPVQSDCDSALPMYGMFMGGDPRAFEPDPEGLKDEEFAAWVRDCEAADAAGTMDVAPVGGFQPLKEALVLKDKRDGAGHVIPAGTIVHLSASQYGYGVTHEAVGPWREWKDILIAARAALEGKAE